MKIFSAAQIRALDAYTIANEPISGLELMERAAGACADWIASRVSTEEPLYLFCGMGNNGGDGLAITRLLHEKGYDARAYIVVQGEKFSPDCAQNRLRLEHTFSSHLHSLYTPDDFPEVPAGAWVVDALFGTGLNRPLSGLAKEAVNRINGWKARVISIDMPSGMQADASSTGGPVIAATDTLSFEFYKLAFMMAENAPLTGHVHILPIGLHPGMIRDTATPDTLTDLSEVRRIYRPRQAFTHKGSYGHALLIAGSYGKMGAAVLCTQACLRAGAGLVTVRVPSAGYGILQTAAPEAMCDADSCRDYWKTLPDHPDTYQAIGVGPGLGTHPDTTRALEQLLPQVRAPMVLDADALNILGAEKRLLDQVPRGSVLTPHPKEFERLFGKTVNDFERLELQRSMSARYGIVIVLKGHHTCISMPDGRCCFNSTGNAGMATGGSGDVLTGILTGLLAQGYDPSGAALLGVYLHGLAGDLGAQALSEESLIASDLARYLGRAFKLL